MQARHIRMRMRSLVLPLALALGVCATPAQAGAPVATPTITVDKTRVLPSGGTITVRGYHFDTSDPGIYVAFGPKNATAQGDFGDAKWIRAGGTGESRLRSDGSFKATLDVRQVYQGSSGEIDCATVADGCAVLTMKAHGVPDPSQSTSQDITFGPTIELSQAQVVPAGGTITVKGAGFAAAPPGIYVTFGPDGATAADDFGDVQYVHTNGSGATKLEADGTFTTTLDVAEVFEDGHGNSVDCSTVAGGCEITTVRAHGIPDPGLTQSVTAPLRFGPVLTIEPSKADRTGDTVTIRGEGFKNPSAGVYLGFGPNRPEFWTHSGTWGATKWIRAGAAPSASGDTMTPEGTFQTTLDISEAYTAKPRMGDPVDIDCAAELDGCAVMTMASASWGHSGGVPTNRSQDAVTPVVFVDPTPSEPVPPPPPAPKPIPLPIAVVPTPPHTPLPTPAPAPAPEPSRSRPTLSKPSLSLRRLRFRVSEPSKVRVVIRRRVVKRIRRDGRVVRVRRWKKVRTITVDADRAGYVNVRPRIGKPGRYRVTIVARSKETGRRGKAKVFIRTVRTSRSTSSRRSGRR